MTIDRTRCAAQLCTETVEWDDYYCITVHHILRSVFGVPAR